MVLSQGNNLASEVLSRERAVAGLLHALAHVREDEAGVRAAAQALAALDADLPQLHDALLE